MSLTTFNIINKAYNNSIELESSRLKITAIQRPPTLCLEEILHLLTSRQLIMKH
jgi:chorismate mutase